MEDNIYIELELFLDPPIIDAAKLETHLNEQIKNWNKQVNANPTLKQRVNKARDFIKTGLRNLQQQAGQARNQKLEELRKQISLYKRTGTVTEKNLKQLNNRFKKFFGEATITNEANGIDSSTVKPLPKFTPPQQPPSLKCNKIVSYADMKNIAKWLKHVKNGRHQNLYQLLELPQSTSTEILFAKAKNDEDIIRKMPKSNIEADFLNSLAQKFLLYFKNDVERASYEIALKREPFDKHCDDEFSLYAENFFDSNKIVWQIYTESIAKTQSLGFSRIEAEWLVYEFYCIKRKCPEPVPEELELDLEDIVEPPPATFASPPQSAYGSAVPSDRFTYESPELPNFTTSVKNAGLQLGKMILSAIGKAYKAMKEYKPPEPTVIQRNETYGQQTVKTETIGNQTEVITHSPFINQFFYTSSSSSGGSRIESSVYSSNVYSSPVESESSSYVYSAAPQSEPAPEQKFPYHAVQIQTLLSEKKFYEVYEMLLPYQYRLPEKYRQLWEQLKSKVTECEKQSKHIKETIDKGKFTQADKLILKLQQYMPDYVGIETHRDEIQRKQFAVTEIEIEIKSLTEKQRWIDAETKLRRFLHSHPNFKEYGLLTVIQQIEKGIQQISESLSGRFACAVVFIVVGCVLFFSAVIADSMQNGNNLAPEETPFNAMRNSDELITPNLTSEENSFFAILTPFIAISFLIAIIAMFFYVVRWLSIFPAKVRRFSCLRMLGNSDLAKPKLSKTVWYTMIEREWQQISQRQQQLQQQQVRQQQSQIHPPQSPPIERINVPKPS
jgi:hypothetical protein